MKTNISTKLFSILIGGFLIISGCSDSTNKSNPPSIPDLSQARPGFDYFNQTNKSIEVGENFQLAKSLTLSMESLIQGFSAIPENFLSTAENSEAELDNGLWTWTYSASGGGQSISIRLTAEETNSQVNWAMYLSANTQQQSFDNYKLFDGFVKNEGNEGEWNFYPFEQESTDPVMTYDWLIASDSQATFNITFGNASYSALSYVKNTPDNTLTLTGENETIVIYWNSSSGEGYYDITGEERVCWDSASNNIACTGA